jgi:hypothetical protein
MDCRDKPGNDDGASIVHKKAPALGRGFLLLRCFEVQEPAGLAFPEHGVVAA